jgi:branched-chain amino acid transport system permease protein
VRQVYTLAAIWVLLLLAPFWLVYIGGYTTLATRVLVLGLGAMALNYLLGFTGVLSFGHAAYVGLGAYGAGMAIKYLGFGTLEAVLAGTAVGTVAAIAIGPLIVRLRGIYFAMVTIAFGQVFYFIAFRWNSVTGGDDGLGGWKRQPIGFGSFQVDILKSELAYYYVVLAFVAIAVTVMGLLLRSPLGRVQLAIRENEQRARFLGVPIERHILLAWVISCLFASLAGTLYALLNNFADPRVLHWSFSGDLVIMAVLGGMRSFWGPLLGAAVFVVLQDYVSSLTQNWMSFIGLFFVLVVLFFPRGVLGILRRARS